jgi:hypothetical protein
MGQTDELNRPKPPRLLEHVVALALPRAFREHVLGDLNERYLSPLSYLKDAASAVPAAMLGQIRRVTPAPYLLLEFALIYASILIAAFWTRGMGPVWGGGGFLKPALAAVYLLMIFTARDVYGGEPLSLAAEQVELAVRRHFHKEVLRRVSTAEGNAVMSSTCWSWATPFRRSRLWMLSIQAKPRDALIDGGRIVADVYLHTFFALSAYWAAQILFPKLNTFLPIMTGLYSVWLVTALLSPLRLWLGIRKHSPVRRA